MKSIPGMFSKNRRMSGGSIATYLGLSHSGVRAAVCYELRGEKAGSKVDPKAFKS